MTGPPPAVAAVRLAVRRALVDLPGPVAVGVSGGADSLALAAGLAFERPGSLALVVDHGLQDDSAQVAQRAAEQCRGLGLEARVLTPPSAGGAGPEATARDRRLAALEAAAEVVLLGHTLDDQAETVLLGLARGSGARALAGMAPVRGAFRRPLLDLPRATTQQACRDLGLTPWEDPHNAELSYARPRVRHDALPALEAALGPGVAVALARTARLLREDADALDELAARVQTVDVAELAALPGAVRSRVLKTWAETLAGPVTNAHVEALRALVEQWHGQGPVTLPTGVRVERRDGRLASST